MKIPKLRVWHLMLLVAATAALLAVLQFRQEVYDPTSAHMRKLQYADAAGKVDAIRGMMAEAASGPLVIESLIGAHADFDPAVRALAARAMAEEVLRVSTTKNPPDDHAPRVKAALAQTLKDPDATVRVHAASALSLLDVKSEESFAILLNAARTPATAPQTIGDVDDRFRALGDLAYCYGNRPETLTAILGTLTAPEARVRNQGIIAFNLFSRGPTRAPATDPIVDALVARLDDEDDIVRGEAGVALSRIGRRVASRAVPLLIRNLGVPRSAFRAMTAEALRNFGIDAADARPNLRALADGNDAPDVRKAAQKALVEIEQACRTFDKETLPEMIAELGNDEPSVRASAAAELAEHGPRAKAAVPTLIKATQDSSPEVREAAAAALKAVEARQGESGRTLRD